MNKETTYLLTLTYTTCVLCTCIGFTVAAPRIWNPLPFFVTDSMSTTTSDGQ